MILSSSGQRTMRTCLDEAERLSAGDVSKSDFEGAKWVFLSGYILYRCALCQPLASQPFGNMQIGRGTGAPLLLRADAYLWRWCISRASD